MSTQRHPMRRFTVPCGLPYDRPGPVPLVWLILTALLCMMATASVSGQTIAGQVVDSLSGLPVGAGFVVLSGADGEDFARTLTAQDGSFTFSLTGQETGQLRIRSERIGYRLAITESFDVPTLDLDGILLRVVALPARLATIEARDASECRLLASESERTAVVWEEARKALSAASWTASTQQYRVVSDVYTLDQDGQRRTVIEETHRPSIGLSTNPFVSRSPGELVRTGYVKPESGGYVYTSPDAHVLQSEGFVNTHCFRLTAGRDSSLIGLAFEPVPSRALPDVAGVLWIDRESWQLRSLDYEFTNLPAEIVVEDPARGSVAFGQLPTGAWIVQRWEIQVPTAFREERVGEFDRRTRQRVSKIRRAGGEVLTIHDRRGALVYETDFAEVVGVVTDGSRGGDVLAGSVVRIPDTWFADTADQSGRFHLRVPLSGEYSIAVTAPRIDSLVFGPRPKPVRLTRGEIREVPISVPPLGELFDRVCPDRPVSAYHRALVGVVMDSATLTPIEGVQVVAQWQHITPRDFSDRLTVGTTDGEGRFALCGLELGRPAMVYGVSSTGMSEVLRVAFEPGRIEIGPFGVIGGHGEVLETSGPIWRRDLTVGRKIETLLAGSIVDENTREPLTGVEVQVPGSGVGTETDSLGVFTFSGLASGDHRFSWSKPGYAARSANVTVASDQPTVLGGAQLALTPVPQLTGVVREAATERPIPLAWMTLVGVAGDSVTRARSDSSGRFQLTAPRDGSYSVAVARLGFGPQTSGPFDLRAGLETHAVVEMTPGVFALDPISVTAEAPREYLNQVGFYQRQRANRGHFMDRADIEERLGSSPDAFQLLAALPGVGVVDAEPGRQGSQIYLNRGVFSSKGCAQGPLIYVDGFRIEYANVGYDAIGMVARPEDIQAIEVYRTPSQIPVQYSGTESACGVILIWTWRGVS